MMEIWRRNLVRILWVGRHELEWASCWTEIRKGTLILLLILLGIISMDFDVRGQILIARVYSSNTWENWEYIEAVYQPLGFKKAYDSVRRKILYILSLSWYLHETSNTLKICLNDTYGRVRVGKLLSDMFPIRNGLKQGGALSPLFFNSAAEHAIGRVQVNQDDLKLNGTYQLLVCTDDVNILS
jgi:hypothetical protein